MYHTRIIPTPFWEGTKQSSPPPKQEIPQSVSKDNFFPLFLLLPLFLAKKKDGP